MTTSDGKQIFDSSRQAELDRKLEQEGTLCLTVAFGRSCYIQVGEQTLRITVHEDKNNNRALIKFTGPKTFIVWRGK